MNPKRIHHVSIVVSDLERGRRFYSEVLGLREIPSPSTFDFTVAWFELNGQHIHLLPRDEADGISGRHFALEVDDAKAARTRFAEWGLEIREAAPIPGCDRFFISDPDGNKIEIMEWSIPYPLEGA